VKIDNIVPWAWFGTIMAGFLLFVPVIGTRAGAIENLSLVRDFDILLSALFFVVCCGLAAVSGRPRLFLSVSPVGLVLVLLLDPNIPAYLLAAESEELRNAFVVGAALFVVTLISQFNHRSVLRVISDSTLLHKNERSLLYTRPYLALFVITVTILFIEIVLIRYTASQIRIFSFYKNIPLIAAFLGLGLGCFRSQGTTGHLLRFFLLLAPTLAFLSQITLFFDDKVSRIAAIASSEFMLGDVLSISPNPYAQVFAQVYTTVFIVLVFLLIAVLFSYLGRFLGDALEQVARLRGYTVDICGSLLGIIIFTVLGYAWAPPVLWIGLGLLGLALIAPRQRTMLGLIPIGLFCMFALCPSIGETVWSPYQKIIGHKVSDGYNLQISDVYYQRARDFEPYDQVTQKEIQNSRYYLTFWQRENLDRVLIVGAGSGNEVTLALMTNAKAVDAVEIDPAIVDFGRRYHPNQPYSDPRVKVIVNDARKAFRELESQSYDMVVFGALDAHTQLGSSSVRLDNYVFTVESIRDATRLVKPGGWVVIAAIAPQQWLQQRFLGLLEAGCGPDSVLRLLGDITIHATCQVGNPPAGGADGSLVDSVQSRVLPVDDWPFIYLPETSIPAAYAITILVLTVVSIFFLKAGGLDLRMVSYFRGHMFFLGAGFLLMEVYAIDRLALLYGTTWIVSAVAIGLVLTLIILANVTTALIPYDLRWPAYAGLFASLLLSYSIDMSTALNQGPLATGLVSLAIVSPVYFAGIIFAKSYSLSSVAGASIGANILGAVLGGWFEYTTMVTGIKSMTLFALALYGASLLCLLAHRGRRVSPA
jgi:SAM-dependent methyltransferase